MLFDKLQINGVLNKESKHPYKETVTFDDNKQGRN